jgi:hypothetical protein
MSYLGAKPHMNPRTYRDLLTMGRLSSGTCMSCHKSSWELNRDQRRMFFLGTRANICAECCERKGDEVIGSIRRSEARARKYARQIVASPDPGRKSHNVSFYARLAGVSEDFMRAAIAKAKGDAA